MTDDPYSDLGGKRESYAEILARAIVLQPEPELTEAERAAKIVAGRERLRQHDAYFSGEFLNTAEQRMVSKELAKSLGYTTIDDRLDMAETGDD